jgi:hypothetical protein
MKYRVRPREPRPLWRIILIGIRVLAYMATSSFGGEKSASFNMLHDELLRRLKRGPVTFDFEVQVRDAADAERHGAVDDALSAWSVWEFPFTKVAEIRIAPLPADFDDHANRTMMCMGQHLSFTPWHNVPDHLPVGTINDARRVAYARVSKLRHELNRKLRREPTADQTAEQYLASIRT